MQGTLKPELFGNPAGPGRAWLWKTAMLAGVLGLGTWLLLHALVPFRLPEDFPGRPDLQSQNAAMRALLGSADAEARKHPNSVEAIGKLGMAYHANQFHVQAESAYGIAARLAQGDYRWPYCQALIREETGREKEAPGLLQKTVQLKPDFLPALQKLGDICFKQESPDEAERYYELSRGASAESPSLQALFGLGRVAAWRRDWRKVIEYVAPLTRQYPHVRPPHQLLAAAYEALGQTDKAAEAQKSLLRPRLIAVPPVRDVLQEELVALSCSSTRLLKEAGLLSRFGRPDDAIGLACRAVEVEPGDADARHFLARTLLETHGDMPAAVDEALAQLKEGLRLRPDDLEPLWYFTANFFEQTKADAAVMQLRSILAGKADREDAHYYLGLVADCQGRIQEAVAHYHAAIRSDPENAEPWHKLGLILATQGKLEEAIAHFRRALDLNPMFALARFNLGVALEQQGKTRPAIAQFAEALRLKPGDGRTHMYLAVALMKSARIGEAVAHFREAVRIMPGDAQGHYGLGCALAMQQKPGEAAGELREALRLQPDYAEARDLLQKLGP